ncbi:MAG: ABC transporter ATP-binding protein, partial [Ruminococcus sp.]|nr:ABC transporter ATP-binding protein [Ruminococcus sp.]
MKKLLIYLKNYKKELFFGPLFKLLEAIFELIVPLVMAKIIDNGIGNNNSSYILKMSIIIVVLGICGLGFALTCQYLASKCAFGFGTELRRALYTHINTLSHSEIDRIGVSSLINRLTNDTNTLQSGVNMFIRLAVRAPFLIIGATVMSMTIDLKLSAIFLIVTPIVAFVIYKVMSKTVPLYKKTQAKLDEAALITRENLEGTRVIRAFSRQEEEIKNFNSVCNELTENMLISGKISEILNPISFMIMNLAIVAVLWFGGVRIDTGSFTQGELTAFVNYMTQISLTLVVLANLIIIFTKAYASANRIAEVFEYNSDIASGSLTEFTDNDNIIEFKNVSFSYNNAGGNSLENLSFEIKKGNTIGIIGGTGSGKSTLINLIPRFYDATEGEVLICGKNVKEYNTDFLRKKIGIVSQKTSIFSGTVRDNMQWADENATDDEIIKALKIAQAWEFVERLPEKLDTHISQGGKNLSGGQKQRLSIARAFVGNPEIIILDDS